MHLLPMSVDALPQQEEKRKRVEVIMCVTLSAEDMLWLKKYMDDPDATTEEARQAAKRGKRLSELLGYDSF